MTEAEQKQMYRRLALCAGYNFTEGMRFAAYLIDDMARAADKRTTDGAVLAAARDAIRARVREREAAPHDSPAVPPRELTVLPVSPEQRAALTVRREAWDKAMAQASSSLGTEAE